MHAVVCNRNLVLKMEVVFVNPVAVPGVVERGGAKVCPIKISVPREFSLKNLRL